MLLPQLPSAANSAPIIVSSRNDTIDSPTTVRGCCPWCFFYITLNCKSLAPLKSLSLRGAIQIFIYHYAFSTKAFYRLRNTQFMLLMCMLLLINNKRKREACVRFKYDCRSTCGCVVGETLDGRDKKFVECKLM